MAVPLNDDTNAQAAEEATKPVVPVWLSEAAEAEAAEEAKRKNRNFAIVIGVALVALVISYALGVHHYTTHFVPRDHRGKHRCVRPLHRRARDRDR